jgi:hypothetical protein
MNSQYDFSTHSDIELLHSMNSLMCSNSANQHAHFPGPVAGHWESWDMLLWQQLPQLNF